MYKQIKLQQQKIFLFDFTGKKNILVEFLETIEDLLRPNREFCHVVCHFYKNLRSLTNGKFVWFEIIAGRLSGDFFDDLRGAKFWILSELEKDFR